MGLRFWIGASGSGKSYRLYQHILEEAGKNPKRNYLIVVPDQFTMQTQLDMVRLSPTHGIMNIDVLSFGRLTHRIMEEVGGHQKPVLDDTGKSLVLRKVACEVEDELTVMKKNVKKIGYIHEVKSALSEFMQYGLGLEQVEKLTEYAKSRGSLSQKLTDLQVLYKGFLSFIQEKYITTEETLDILRKALPKSKVIQDSVIVFDGFTGFTPVQYNVIQELFCHTSEVIMTITMDARENPYLLDGEQKLFHLSKKTIADLRKRAKQVGASIEKDVIIDEPITYRYKDNPGLAHLERELFRYPSKEFTKKQDSIQIFEASNPREEIRQICIAIKKLVREQGYCYRDIAVVTGDVERYGFLAKEEFEKFEIPYFLDQTNKLVLNPFIEYMRSALQVSIQDFSYESVFHFLRSGLTGISPEDVDKLENYVVSFGIRGKAKWSKAFTRKNKQEEYATEMMHLNQLREQIMEMLEPLLVKQALGKDMIMALYRFVVAADMEEKLAGFEREFEQENDHVKAKEYGQIYRLVMDLLDQMMELLGEEMLTQKEFAEILDAGFAEIKVGMIPQTVDKVVIGDIERTRLCQIKTLFFAGVNDGIIPKSGGTGGIISDIDREFLQESEFELAPSPRQKMFIQRLYLYMVMTKPTNQLVLSYSQVDNEGKSIRPAYLVSTVKKLFPELEILHPEEEPMLSQMASTRDTLEDVVKLLRSYADGEIGENRMLFFTLYDIYQTQFPDLMGILKQAAFFTYEDQPIPRQLAKSLYGQILKNSVSRLEKYASCAYAHFLSYGLGLSEKEQFSFEAVDMGNIFHDVLEAFSKRLPETGYTWFDFPKDKAEELVQSCLEEYVATYGETILYSSKRNEYMITRMNRILNRTVNNLQYQLTKGAFAPENFELSFYQTTDLDAVNVSLSEEEKMHLMGRIDRLDTCTKDDKLYVKIIDYKSGKHDFDLAALYHGLQLQLVVYMNAAMEAEKKAHPDMQVEPAAMLYYHLDDPILETDKGKPDIEEINQAIRKELKLTGVVNSDMDVINLLDRDFVDKSVILPVDRKKDGSFTAASHILSKENFAQVSSFVNDKIQEIGKEILAGKISYNPYEMEGKQACTYCSYRGACGFDKRLGQQNVRKLEKYAQDVALEQIIATNNAKKDV